MQASQASLPFEQPTSGPASLEPPNPEPSNPEPSTLEPPNPEQPNPESKVPTSAIVFVRHPRARRYLIRVIDDGTVRVTVPRWGSKREAREFAERERAWIAKQQRRAEGERRERERRERERATTEGVGDERSAIAGANGERSASADAQRARRDRASRELPARLLELAVLHGLTVTRVSIRNQRWRWGSCSRSGHICLNWRLATMPESVRDYVMIHELMHLKRMDHSPAFWKLVEAACPDYQNARRWLRQVPRG
jgi:predicted metal-dependent hydrolase